MMTLILLKQYKKSLKLVRKVKAKHLVKLLGIFLNIHVNIIKRLITKQHNFNRNIIEKM